MHGSRALATVVGLCLASSASVGSYTVRRGDTLGRLARRLGVPVTVLASANNIADVDRVQAGQVLTVPSPRSEREAAGAPAREDVHRVRAGETLERVARRYGTSVAELRRANGLPRAARLREGQALVVPRSAATTPPIAGICPVRGASRHDFGDSWGSPRHRGRRHTGNDIFARRGTAVVANVSGRLQPVTGSVTGLGYYLHGDDGHTYYGAHLEALRARPGRIDAGAMIGIVGSTGNARGTPPHLHFEIKPRRGPSVDPYPILRAWCRGR
jgi:murein DD-endopeptidase MepM/ murein hydrolase activator NlpD